MSLPSAQSPAASRTDEDAVSGLHRQLLDAWNRRAAEDFAALFAEDAYVVGFDGSQMDGRAADSDRHWSGLRRPYHGYLRRED